MKIYNLCLNYCPYCRLLQHFCLRLLAGSFLMETALLQFIMKFSFKIVLEIVYFTIRLRYTVSFKALIIKVWHTSDFSFYYVNVFYELPDNVLSQKQNRLRNYFWESFSISHVIFYLYSTVKGHPPLSYGKVPHGPNISIKWL